MENLGIGAKCSLNYCNQNDYLPFACKLCKDMFCHDHMGNHECGKKHSDDIRGMKCPDCLETLKYTGAEDSEVVLQNHKNNNKCVKKLPQKSKKCITCYTKLTQINIHECNTCHQLTCLKHRVPGWHTCNPSVSANTQFKPQRLVSVY